MVWWTQHTQANLPGTSKSTCIPFLAEDTFNSTPPAQRTVNVRDNTTFEQNIIATQTQNLPNIIINAQDSYCDSNTKSIHKLLNKCRKPVNCKQESK